MSRSKALCYVSALLLITLLVTQFVPFWHFGEGEAAQAVSIGGYIWFPTEHTDLTSHLASLVDADFKVNDVILFPILTLVLCAAGAVLNLIRPDSLLSGSLTALAGGSGVLAYLTAPALRLGTGWVWHLILALLALIAGVSAIIALRQSEHS